MLHNIPSNVNLGSHDVDEHLHVVMALVNYTRNTGGMRDRNLQALAVSFVVISSACNIIIKVGCVKSLAFRSGIDNTMGGI